VEGKTRHGFDGRVAHISDMVPASVCNAAMTEDVHCVLADKRVLLGEYLFAVYCAVLCCAAGTKVLLRQL
jgi:hypothetical protein